MKISPDDLLRVEHVAALDLDKLKAGPFRGVSTDSRAVKPSELFFAISGEKFDGHQFVGDAFCGGASCAVVSEGSHPERWNGRPLLVVKDTIKALGQLANIYRKKFDIPFIAVAGSNGKTTTKEMIASVLNTQYAVLSTRGNLNNHIGVPQTLFHLEPRHEVAVVEIGTNHFGEISYLCGILQPTHGLITNIGREHLEFFRDIDGVAAAEGELFKSLTKEGVGLVNLDDRYIARQAEHLKRKITYGFSRPRCSVRGKFVGMDKKGCAAFSVKARNKSPFTVQLGTPGTHAGMNALAAAATGIAFGISRENIQLSLKKFRTSGKRMEILRAGGVTVIDDTYNSNPDSVLSSLQALKEMPCKGKKIVVLADMLELGDASRREHELIGEAVGEMGFEYLLTYGPMAKHASDRADVKLKAHYDQKNILSEYAATLASEGDIILVKGSRGMKMEDVIVFLRASRRRKINTVH